VDIVSPRFVTATVAASIPACSGSLLAVLRLIKYGDIPVVSPSETNAILKVERPEASNASLDGDDDSAWEGWSS
jgi:hypothetical protein